MNIKTLIPTSLKYFLREKPFLSDKFYLKQTFKKKMGYPLNLKNPLTFNEKLQWLKLNDRKDIYTKMVDKFEAKKYVANVLGDDFIIPTLGVYKNFDEIDFSSLPNEFVLKTTHDSGGVCICRNKNDFDYNEAKNKITKSLKKKYYWHGREWSYKNVVQRI